MDTPREAIPDSADSPERLLADLERLLRGECTLADVYGLTREDVHQMAGEADRLLGAGRIADALVLYEGCVALNPLDVHILCGFGATLQLAGHAGRAESIFEVVAELAPGEPTVTELLKAVRSVPVPA